jgi:hypothetical protein
MLGAIWQINVGFPALRVDMDNPMELEDQSKTERATWRRK